VVGKKENTVLLDGSTHGPAELIQPKGWLISGIEVIAGVELLVAEVFKRATVKLVRTRLCDQVDDAAERLAVFRRERGRVDPEFLDGVDAGASDPAFTGSIGVFQNVEIDA